MTRAAARRLAEPLLCCLATAAEHVADLLPGRPVFACPVDEGRQGAVEPSGDVGGAVP